MNLREVLQESRSAVNRHINHDGVCDHSVGVCSVDELVTRIDQALATLTERDERVEFAKRHRNSMHCVSWGGDTPYLVSRRDHRVSVSLKREWATWQAAVASVKGVE